MMDRELVLITGVTGHVGFRVLQYALDHGFAVRAVVRSEAKADKVRSNPALRATNEQDSLSFAIVPDFTVAGAFDDAVKDAKYIIHCASPIPLGRPATTDNAHEEFVKPAVDATLGMFRSAEKADTVKRVVVTSSCIAVAPVAAALADTGETYTADTRQPEMQADFEPGTPTFVAYAAGKVAALNRTEAWMKETQPSFDVIHLMPSYVLGRNEMCETLDDLQACASSFVVNIVCGSGGGDGAAGSMAMVVNHVDDCARIHVEALSTRIAGNQSFMICNDCWLQPQWDDAKAIVDQHFPEAVKAGILPNKGGLGSVFCRLESAKTEETFGLERTYEDAVKDVAQQYLELHEKERERLRN